MWCLACPVSWHKLSQSTCENAAAECSARRLSQHDVDQSTGTGAFRGAVVAALSSPLRHGVNLAAGGGLSLISDEVRQKGSGYIMAQLSAPWTWRH